ncbi:MAG: molybdenum cofactor biosynthesis protein [Planctomycetota bacterium]
MKLEVQLFASLRERAGRSVLALDALPEPLDVAGLKRELARRHPELGELGFVRGVVGTSYVSDATPLSEGVSIALLPPVSGGAPDSAQALAQGVFELCAASLDPALAQRRVVDAGCGAVCMFTGTTRGHNRGKQVVKLEYEAFDAMTGPEMARIFERCRRELEADDGARALRMLVQHRVGTVGVGEPSVVIAVASPHRDLAFRAARFLIDELKASLPIWKKEHYPDGEHWVGERS